MKARVEQLSTQQDVTLVKRPLKLTIGILVSNSKNTIRRCLDSIKPLLEQVPSELIVTDTGGTDGAIEIAKEYTDKIEKFTWCDDFSAARNVALQKAQGEWFLFLDDDEWFDAVSELIAFFNSSESQQFNCLNYKARNYSDYSGKNYTDSLVTRCFRWTPNVAFVGIIHESPNQLYAPIKHTDCFVHHYGYASTSNSKGGNRGARNIPLLKKELEQDRKNFRAWYHLIKEYVAQESYQEAINAVTEFFLQSPEKTSRYYTSAMLLCVNAYYNLNRLNECIDTIQNYLKEDFLPHSVKMSLQYTAQGIYIQQGNYESAFTSGNYFLQDRTYLLQHKEVQNEEDWGTSLDILRPHFYQSVLLRNSLSSFKLEKQEEAYSFIEQISFEDMGTYTKENTLKDYLRILSTVQHPKAIQTFYTICSKQSSFRSYIGEYLQTLRRKDKEAHRYFAEELSRIDDETDAYIWLNRTYLAMLNQDKEALTTCWNWFLDHVEDCAAFYEDILLYAMEQELDIAPFVEQMDFEDWQAFISAVLSHPEQKAFFTLMNYFQNHQTQQSSLKLQYWTNCMRENILLHATAENGMEAMLPIFQNYAEGLASYMHHFYTEEAFTGTAYDCLPRVYRFAYQMEQAFAAKKQGNVRAYMDGLKSALKAYPVMKDYISLLVNKLEEEQQATSVQQQEFLALAKTIKSRVEQLITARELEQAEQLIAELSSLLPNDADLGMYRLLIEQAKLAETTLTGQVTQ